MNKARRKQIADLLIEAEALKSKIEEVRDDEQSAFDAMPESLQNGERGTASSDALAALEDAMNGAEEVENALESIE